jgi:opacity protein-like surface antigen
MLRVFLVSCCLLASTSSYAAYFQEIDGSDLPIFEEHDPRSYDLFRNHIQPPTDKIYLKISSGLSSAVEIKDRSYVFQQHNYSIPANIAIGIKFSKLFNFELFGNSRINHDMKVSFNTEYATYRFNSYGAGVLLSMDLIQSYDLIPYIGAGVGIYRNAWKVIEKTAAFSSEKDIDPKIILNHQVVIGARYKINQNFHFFAEYAYRKIGDLKEEDAYTNDFSIGLMFQ